MPFFQVALHGDGVLIVNENPEHNIIGFYTTRIVRASDEANAARAACTMVQAQWLSPPYKTSNVGGPPRLQVESVQRSSIWSSLRFRNTGHSFYRED